LNIGSHREINWSLAETRSVFTGKAGALRARARQWHLDAVVHLVQSIQGE
jgi:hypothetical protein